MTECFVSEGYGNEVIITRWVVACEFSRLSSLLAADVTTGGRFGGGETTVLYSKAKWAVESRGSTEFAI